MRTIPLMLVASILQGCISLQTGTRHDTVEVHKERVDRPRTKKPAYEATLEHKNGGFLIRVSAKRKVYQPYSIKRHLEDRKITTTSFNDKSETYFWASLIGGGLGLVGGAALTYAGTQLSSTATKNEKTDGFGNRYSVPDYTEPQNRTMYLSLGIPLALGGAGASGYALERWSRTGSNTTVEKSYEESNDAVEFVATEPTAEVFEVKTAYGTKRYKTGKGGATSLTLDERDLALYQPIAIVRFADGTEVSLDAEQSLHDEAINNYLNTLASETRRPSPHPQPMDFAFLPAYWLTEEAVERLPAEECMNRCSGMREVFGQIESLAKAGRYQEAIKLVEKAEDSDERAILTKRVLPYRVAAAKALLREIESLIQKRQYKVALEQYDHTTNFIKESVPEEDSQALADEAASLGLKALSGYHESLAANVDSLLKRKKYQEAFDFLRSIEETLPAEMFDEKKAALKKAMPQKLIGSYRDALWLYPPNASILEVFNPSANRGKWVKLPGKIFQALGNGQYLLSVGEQEIYISTIDEQQYIDGQFVEVIGQIVGTKRYSTRFGSRTVPSVLVIAIRSFY